MRCPVLFDKNHNPRKGTETFYWQKAMQSMESDKNHNPRKGTETEEDVLNDLFSRPIRTIIPARGRKQSR